MMALQLATTPLLGTSPPYPQRNADEGGLSTTGNPTYAIASSIHQSIIRKLLRETLQSKYRQAVRFKKAVYYYYYYLRPILVSDYYYCYYFLFRGLQPALKSPVGKSSTFITLSSNFDQFVLIFLNFFSFLPHFGLPCGGVAHPEGPGYATAFSLSLPASFLHTIYNSTNKLYCSLSTFAFSGVCFPVRYTFMILGFFGNVTSYTMRLNLSVAIVAMVDQPSSELNQSYVNNTECPGEFKYANTTHEVNAIN